MDQMTLTIVASNESVAPTSDKLAIRPLLASLERNVHVAVNRLQIT